MMGYPRYDWMLHPSMSKDEILDSLFGWKGKKAVLWMPTFRKSDLGGCAENEIELPCQLPAIQDMNELKELDSLSKGAGDYSDHKEASASDGMG